MLGWAAMLAISLLPLRLNEVTAFNAGLVLIFVVAALGLHLLVNWAGQLSLAHAGMVGLPALVVILVSEVSHVSPLYLLPVGVLVGAGTGALVSLPAIRAQGLNIALVTLTAGVAINAFFFQQHWLIGASGSRAAATPSLGPIEFNTSKDLYVPLLVIVAITLLFFWMLMNSKVGRAWLWMAADPSAASTFGIPIAAYKVAAYGAAGSFAGLGGALMAAWVRHLSPLAFPLTLSFTFLLAAVLAGRGFAGGVLLSGLTLRAGPLFFPAASSGVNRALLYLGPIGLIITLSKYKAGFNGGGRALVDKLVGSKHGRRGRANEGRATRQPLLPPMEARYENGAGAKGVSTPDARPALDAAPSDPLANSW